MPSLHNRVVIVTGAARGIGAEVAARLAQYGARVLAADRVLSEETVRRVRSARGVIEQTLGDVTTADGAASIAAAAHAAFGKIDGLVNNAALYGGIRLCPFEEIKEAEWDAVLTTNVKSVWQMCRAVVPSMRTHNYGRIVNVSSNVIFMGKPGFLHYVASKGAVWAMTNALSREVAGSGITVNGIAPGYTLTQATRGMTTADDVASLERDIIKLQSVKRLIEPTDLSGAVAFLVSDAAAMITGQTLTIDGGAITH